MSRLKNTVWNSLPPSFRKWWTGPVDDSKYGWHGSYSTWKEAQEHSTGYDAGAIAEKVFSAAQKVKSGEALFERDGMLFRKPEYPQPTFRTLKDVATNHGGQLNVVDFGGGPASAYFLYKHLLPAIKLNWHVIEQEHYAQRGNQLLADASLKFHSEINADSCSGMNVLMLLSVLHYVENPNAIVAALLEHSYERIIIETTPVVLEGNSMITVQNVPPAIYEASYPCHIFNETEMLNWFPGYSLKEKYTTDVVPGREVAGRMTEWRGYILEKNK